VEKIIFFIISLEQINNQNIQEIDRELLVDHFDT
jgi:hypothetical protein